MEDNYRGFEDERGYLSERMKLELVRLQFRFNGEITAMGQRTGEGELFHSITEQVAYLLEGKLEQEEVVSEDALIMAEWENYFKGREQASQQRDQRFFFREAAERAGLSSFGQSVLTLALMAWLDRDYRVILSYFNGRAEGTFPTVEGLAKVFFYGKPDSKTNFYREAEGELLPLSRLFPALSVSEHPFQEPLVPDRRLAALLLRTEDYFPYWLSRHQPEESLDPLFFREKEKETLRLYLLRLAEEGPAERAIFLYGEKGAGKKHLLCHLCGEEGRGVVFFHLSLLERGEETESGWWKTPMKIALREALLRDEPLAITGFECWEEEERQRLIREAMTEAAASRVSLLFLSEEEEQGAGQEGLLPLELPVLDEAQRRTVWEHYGQGMQLLQAPGFSALVNTFEFTPGQIRSALDTAALFSENHTERLYEICYNLVDHSLDQKAKRVRSTFTWEELVLPKEDKELLRDLCNRVKNRHIVLSQWGFARRLPYGGGVSAVFAGPPGTGKTMAAQVIANELKMQLYQIDLSQVVDKYIGETEKNIRLIFQQAKKSSGILFFDEADSLFAKRVENTSSSNDRFVNIESALLLQCMEEYGGISLLATNHYSTIDPAFIRRFKYLINFRLPDETLRLKIWEGVFPKGVPLSEELDFPWLASAFELTGAYIKNVALSAAFLAAEEGGRVELRHIFKGLKREMQKEGRKLSRAEMAHFGSLFDEL